MKIFLGFFIFFLSFSAAIQAASIKEPNVAGSFYSADAKKLSTQIDTFINQATNNPTDEEVQAMIFPHAGYVYSGPVAAYGFKAISHKKYSTIVILAPSHYFPFDGISIWPEGGFRTPLGVVEVDADFAKKLMDPSRGVLQYAPTNVYEKEHSLEAQLPFLQKTFNHFKIVPVLMGNPDPQVAQKLASALNDLIGTRQDVLVLASSDMSHYFTYDVANSMDELTLGAIKDEDAKALWDGNLSRKMEMCGFVPVTTVLLYAKMRGLKVNILKHANSGDTAGDKSRVVGYSSVIFYKDKATDVLNADEKEQLLSLAQDTLTSFVTTGKAVDSKTNDTRLLKTQGAFVTLKKDGQLRGCIGNIIGDKPLWQIVHDMTIEAASRDPRFSPVTKDELKSITLEISVLSVPQKVADASAIVLGRDGVIVSDGGFHQGVFLPQVATETNWSEEEFLGELCSQKAGLPSDCWKDSKNTLLTFQADVFGL